MRRISRAATWLAISLGAVVAPVQAQRRGATVPVVDSRTFITAGQSMWGPLNEPANIDMLFSLVNQAFNAADSAGHVETVLSQDFGAKIKAASSGLIEVSGRLRIPGTGGVNISYPARIELKVPEPNSFRDGEEIAIQTGYALTPGWTVSTTAPSARIDLTGRFGIHASAGASICLFSCAPFDLFPAINIDNSGFDLVTLESNGGMQLPLLGSPKPLPHTFSFIESEESGVSGTVDIPRFPTVETSVAGDGKSLVFSGSQSFVDISVDLDSYLNKIGFPIPLGQQTPNIGGAEAGYNIIDVSTPVKFTGTQQMLFRPNLQLDLTLPVEMAWRVTDATDNVVSSGFGTAVRLTVGNTLRVTFPAGRRQSLSASPTYTMDNTFSTQSNISFGAGFVETVGTFLLKVPSVEITPATTIDPCEILTVGLEHCPQDIPAVTSPQISVNLGPLKQFNQPLSPAVVPLFPRLPADCTAGTSGCGHWTLQGFQPRPGTAFDLDPEDARIAVETSIASGVGSRTGPAGTLVQTVTVHNTGDVSLSTAQIANALSKQFANIGGFSVNSVTSATLSPNGSFNGTSDVRTLAGSDVLEPGATSFVTVNFGAQPGNVYRSAVAASGTSPIGTAVGSEAAAGFAVYAFEFGPSRLVGPTGGVLPAILRGSSSLDVHDIDPSTLRIDGVAPLRWDYEQMNGVWALTLKFDRASIWEVMQSRRPTMAAMVAQAAPDVTSVASTVLRGNTRLASDALLLADRLGNRNGRVDVGDLRALVLQQGGSGSGGIVPVVNATADAKAKDAGVTIILPVTGTMKDGTPMAGEAGIIMGGGQ